MQGNVQQVQVYTAEGKPAGEIGRKGGRWALGPWVLDGVLHEIAVPLATLGLKPFAGMKLSGDFGATHMTPAGDDTLLRTY